MVIYFNRSRVSSIQLKERFYNKDISLGVDTSKTNTAVSVMELPTYKLLGVIEFNGKEDDILDLIKMQRDVLSSTFKGSNIKEFGIEDIITTEKGDSNSSNGLQYHHSRYVITAVFVSMICWCQDFADIKPDIISNQSYKHSILPPELNKRGIYKGSVDFIKKLYPLYIIEGMKNDDVADAICISLYMKMKAGLPIDKEVDFISSTKELVKKKYKYALFPITRSIGDNVKRFYVKSDEKLNIDDIANNIANRLDIGEVGYSRLSVEDIPLKYIYERCVGTYTTVTHELNLVVKT